MRSNTAAASTSATSLEASTAMPTASTTTFRFRWRFPRLQIILPLVVAVLALRQIQTTTTTHAPSFFVCAHSPLLPSSRRRQLFFRLHWKSASPSSPFLLKQNNSSSSLLLRAGDGSGNSSDSTAEGGGRGTKTTRDENEMEDAAPIPPSPFSNNDDNNNSNSNNNILVNRSDHSNNHSNIPVQPPRQQHSPQQQQQREDGAIPALGADEEEEVVAHVGIAKKLKNRNATNLSRKLTHAGFGIFFACLNQFVPKSTFVPCMGILTASTLLMELLRYRRGFHWMNVALHYILGGALRKHEMEGMFTGSFYYFAGVLGSAYLFPKTAGTMGICQLALADPSASYFGRRTRHIYWSRIENGLGGLGRNKGILGFLGGALFCFPFNYRVFKIAKWGVGRVKGAAAVPPGGEVALVCASLLLGLAGAFADLAVPTPALTMPKKVLGIPVPPFHLDDNFVVPIFSGWACTKIFKLMGWDNGLELAEHIIF